VVGGGVTPVLGLNAGFHRELTGIENVYLNALLLGRSRREVEAALDDIVAFSELGDFIHSPLRSYSSGMMARLGFAVATAWIPEVLLLDEVFAVGDAGFLEKCQERLRRFHRQGTTVILVTHNVAAVKRTCTRCLWLERGRLVADDSAEAVLRSYWRSLVEGGRP
jgi:ABC-type polysaccharide/polyol phosphate transport system ATPase subunit